MAVVPDLTCGRPWVGGGSGRDRRPRPSWPSPAQPADPSFRVELFLPARKKAPHVIMPAL